MFELFLFHTNIDFDELCIENGIHGLVVDLERRGKIDRQQGFPTQINTNSTEDITEVKLKTEAYIICRINGVNSKTAEEVKRVIDAGADEILIPMIRTAAEIDYVLKLADGCCSVSAMIETVDAVKIAAALDDYPLKRIYIGLTDLWIERGSPHIFCALSDGIVSLVRQHLPTSEFGFAGLTLPDKGKPLPCIHLINEMTLLDCSFSFLRRSFIADILGRDVKRELPRLLRAIEESAMRDPEDKKNDHIEAVRAINRLPAGPWRI